MTTATPLSENIRAYEALCTTLECDHFGEWVVFHNNEIVDFYEDFQDAAAEAVMKFGRGPYLIRQIGAAPPSLPISVLYQPQHYANC